MKWRGLVARLRNGFNMQEDEEGEDEEGKKKEDVSLGVSGTDSSLCCGGSISWDRVTPAISLEALMLSIC